MNRMLAAVRARVLDLSSPKRYQLCSQSSTADFAAPKWAIKGWSVRNPHIPYARELGVATVSKEAHKGLKTECGVATMCAAEEVKVGCGKKRKWLLFNPNNYRKLPSRKEAS
jgi:hypothetical protein